MVEKYISARHFGCHLEKIDVYSFLTKSEASPLIISHDLMTKYSQKYFKIIITKIIVEIPVFGRHIGRHLEFLKTPNGDKVSSVRFLKDNAYSTGIHQEKNFIPDYQVQ